MAVRWRVVALFGLVALGAAPRGTSAQTLDAASRLLVQADTAAAIAIFEDLIDHNLRNAEAHYRLGLIHRARIVPDAAVDKNRRIAEEHFRYAARFESDSAKYLLALADLFRREDNSFTRLQVPRLIERARAAAIRHGADAADLTTLEYRAARVEWERYEHFGRRYLANDFVGAVRTGVSAFLFDADWRYVESFFRTRSRMASRDAGEEYRVKAEDRARAALDADPANIDAAGLLVVLMGEHDRWPEALEQTRNLVRVSPDSGRAWALLGLALTRERRWQEAEAAFDTALALMAPRDWAPYLDLGRIMRRGDRRDYTQMSAPSRAALDTTYWAAAQPLALTDANELRVEFFARITYVDHRWSDPYLNFRGFDTDIGAVYVRYGPPDIWAMFNRQEIAWVYVRARLRFLFNLTPGFTRARFGDFGREAARVAAERSPARFDNVPIFLALDTVLVQTAQFRGPNPQQTLVAVFSAIPVRRMVDSARITDLALETAVILWTGTGRELARHRRDNVLRDVPERDIRNESWYLSLPPNEYILRVEAHLPVLERGARSAAMLRVRSYETGGALALSDVLAADRVAPRDSNFTRWSDFLIGPNAGRFEPESPLALLWEIYNLPKDSLGTTQYTVNLAVTVDAIERHGWAARVIGGIGDAMGLSALGDDKVEISYERQVETGPDGTQVEYLTVDLRDAPEGTYTITVQITEHVTGQTASRTRVITIGSGPTTRQ